jgi:hypothetical protein
MRVDIHNRYLADTCPETHNQENTEVRENMDNTLLQCYLYIFNYIL